jgi:hypothetical protein
LNLGIEHPTMPCSAGQRSAAAGWTARRTSSRPYPWVFGKRFVDGQDVRKARKRAVRTANLQPATGGAGRGSAKKMNFADERLLRGGSP